MVPRAHTERSSHILQAVFRYLFGLVGAHSRAPCIRSTRPCDDLCYQSETDPKPPISSRPLTQEKPVPSHYFTRPYIPCLTCCHFHLDQHDAAIFHASSVDETPL